MSSASTDRIEALLGARRIAEALALADALVANDPDGFDGHYWRAECQLAAGRTAQAEEGLRRAVASEPDNPRGLKLAVRCALRSGPKQLIWERAQSLAVYAATHDDVHASYLVAVAAAAAQHADDAARWVGIIAERYPASDWVLYARADVDLALAGARRSGRARIAESAADELLARDPLDEWAHSIRNRAASAHRTLWRRRDHALRRIGYLRDAASAGYRPATPQIRQLTVEAIGPVALAGVWVLLSFLGSISVDSIGWPASFVVVAVWLVAYVAWRRRFHRVFDLLPNAGRGRLLQPVARSMVICAALLACAAAIGLAKLHPYTRDHAVALGLGSSKGSTHIVVIPAPTARPAAVSPTSPLLSGTNGVGGLPIAPPTLPSLPSLPSIREVSTTRTNPELGWNLLRYYCAICACSFAVAGAAAFESIRIRRASR